VRLFGDEFFHWHEDLEGYPIVYVPARRVWTYARRAAGGFQATRYVVGKTSPAALGLAKADRETLRRIGVARREARILATSGDDGIPQRTSTTGTMRNLVVLVNFADLAVEYPRGDYDALFNETGYTVDGAKGSVKDYYLEISYQRLTVESTVVEPVTLEHGYAYYGENDASGWDIRPREMVREALEKLEERGFDFSAVDGDDDGWADGLTIIHAGGGEEYGGNDPNYIWSHKWQLTSTVTYDGVRMRMYHTEPARRGWDSQASTQGITRIGVICHESGHFLGLPDLYDYGNDSKGAGVFAIMAGGSWNGNHGTQPAHMCAWSKATLGWVTPTEIAAEGSYTLLQVQTSGQVYKLQGAFPDNEYFLVENRQGVGFDAALPGPQRGILIWHIDDSRSDNNDQTHYMVDLEEASGTQHLEQNLNSGADSDYFRAGNATEFSFGTSPDNRGYGGEALDFNIVNVSVTGEEMSFDVTGGQPEAERFYVESLAASDFAGAGEAQGWQGDEETWFYRLPFSFPFFRVFQTSVWISSNGFIDFASSDADYRSSTRGLVSNRRIAPLWTDVVVDEIYIHQPTVDSVCIRWQGTEWADEEPLNFALILFRDGRIKFSYGDGNTSIGSGWTGAPTIGISCGDGANYYLSAHDGKTNLGNAQTVLWTPVSGDDLVIEPISGMVSEGPVGGPFEPVSKTYTLRNDGDEPLQWVASVEDGVNWLDLSRAGGTLEPGTDVTVAVSINDEALGLAKATHEADVTFTNATSGADQARRVSLRVGVEAVRVTSPNGGEAWLVDSARTISWVGQDIDAVKLEYSVDGGQTWTVITADTPNDGSHAWIVPDQATDEALVRVSDAADGDPADQSDAVFAIVAPSLRVTYPNGGEVLIPGDTYDITWAHDQFVDRVRIEYTVDGGANWDVIANDTANDGACPWTVPDRLTDTAWVRVSGTGAGDPSDTSNAPFSIQPGAPVRLSFLSSPNTGRADEVLQPSPIVEVRDANGNRVVGSAARLTMTIAPETGKPGAVLGGTLTITATGGAATFPDLTIDRAGAAYRLHARAEGMIGGDSDPFDVTGGAVLTVSKSANPDPVEPGADLTYTLTFGNGGDEAATGVVITDRVPANTVFKSASDGGQHDPGNGEVQWNLGALDAGTVGRTVTLVVTVNADVPAGTMIVNDTYRVDSAETLPFEGETVETGVSDHVPPFVDGLSPAASGLDNVQVPRDTAIRLHVRDRGAGVDRLTVVITLDGTVVYNGAAEAEGARYTSTRGVCHRSGSADDYSFLFAPDDLFGYEQTVAVEVRAGDLQGNAMPAYDYSFTTRTRVFSEELATSISRISRPAATDSRSRCA